MWQTYGHFVNLAEIMELSLFDIAKQHKKPREGPAFLVASLILKS